MKKNLTPILIVAFVMAIVCTGIFYGLVAGRLGSGAQASTTAQILVAAKAIPRGSSVSVLDVRTAPWVGNPVPEGALQQPDQVVGLTALTDIGSGEPLLSSRLMNKGGGGGLGIPSGMRAVSVRVLDSSGVVALLKTGHHVDVQAVYTRTGTSQDSEIRTVLENIEVLKIDAEVEAPGRPAGPVATLLVTPSEADTVALAEAVARVRLVLRNPLDAEKSPRGSLNVSGLMKGSHVSPLAAPVREPRRAPLVAPQNSRAPAGLSLAPGGANTAACDPPKSTPGSGN